MFVNYTGYLSLAMTAATALPAGDGQTDARNYNRALETLAESLQYYDGEIIVLPIVLCNYQNYKEAIHTNVDQWRAAVLVTSISTQTGVSGVMSSHPPYSSDRAPADYFLFPN
jgi:hypothetical protein